MTKRDPYKHKERFEKWKLRTSNGIDEISNINSKIILEFIHDMEYGLNVSIKNIKGGRSFIRLNSLIEKMTFFAKRFYDEYKIEDLKLITEEQAGLLFTRI